MAALHKYRSAFLALSLVTACAPMWSGPGLAQGAAPADAAAGSGPTYADLADLADSSPLVVRVQIRKLVRVEDERAPGLMAGHARYYVEARTVALLAGGSAVGESLTYLVDLRLDERGKPPALKKQEVVLFARPVSGRPGELQLTRPSAQLAWSEPLEARLRAVLSALLSPDAPARVTGVREMLHVPGTLAGQGETQIFLKTANGSAASITVRHEPGAPPVWGASFSELVADVGRPPERDTLIWYRLACFLPNSPPSGANLSDSYADKRQADADYRMVLGELGVCERRLN